MPHAPSDLLVAISATPAGATANIEGVSSRVRGGGVALSLLRVASDDEGGSQGAICSCDDPDEFWLDGV
jgi:hypothetical protein